MSEIRTFEFNVYTTPKSMNAGGGGSREHWARGHREKRAWEQDIMAELMVARVPRGAELASANVTLNWKQRRRRDVTNYYATVVKPLADALVKWGLITDDTDDKFVVSGFRAVHQVDWPTAAARLAGYVNFKIEAHYP